MSLRTKLNSCSFGTSWSHDLSRAVRRYRSVMAKIRQFYVETRTNGLPWTKEGCNLRKDGAWVPYPDMEKAIKAIRDRQTLTSVFDDPMWAEAEYRTMRA